MCQTETGIKVNDSCEEKKNAEQNKTHGRTKPHELQKPTFENVCDVKCFKSAHATSDLNYS